MQSVFLYENLSPIQKGDRVKINVSNLTGVIDIKKGAWCVVVDNKDIDPILFYNIYIHESNVIKAFIKID